MRLAYRPEIDGLRTLAVVPVVLFHAGLAPFKGGFVGVDVFFVISGYLITSILLADLSKGSFSLLRFYDRRIRRIIPALVAVVLASFVMAYLWMPTDQLREFAKDVVAVSLFGSNIRYMAGGGYFDAAEQLRPLLHTWSLAIEEQFYVVFPLLLFALWRWWRPHLLTVSVILLAISLAFAEYMSQTDSLLNYYLLPTRAWELLAGSVLAMKGVRPGVVSRWKAEAGSALGVGLILVSVFLLGEEFRYPSLWTVIPVIGAMLVIAFADARSLAGQMLGSRPFVGIGLLSYSFYLWHQPVFVFARLRFGQDSLSTGDYLALVGLSLALSWATYLVLERPIRRQSFASPIKIATAALAATVFMIVGARYTVIQGKHWLPLRNPLITQLSERLKPAYGLAEACDGAVDIPDCKTDDQPVIAVWGDSHARHLVDGLKAARPDIRMIQLTKSACTAMLHGAGLKYNPGPDLRVSRECLAFNDRVVEWLSHNESVEFVVIASLMSQFSVDRGMLDAAGNVVPGGPEKAVEELRKTIDWVKRIGKTPVLVTSPPINGKDFGDCFYRHEVFGTSLDACGITRKEDATFRKSVYGIYSALEPFAKVIRLRDLLCEGETCLTHVGDMTIYRDTTHLSREGSVYLSREFDLYGRITGEETRRRVSGGPNKAAVTN